MTKRELIDALNDDLAQELRDVILYLNQSSLVVGLERLRVGGFLRKLIQDELEDAQFLADKIVALGGVPTTTPAPVPEFKDLRAMLEYDLEGERKAIKRYTERARQAEAFGDLGLKIKLEEIIADETEHAEEFEKLLR